MGSKVFTKDSFVCDFNSYLQKNGGKYAKAAVEKEFDCLKNTYVSDKAFGINKIIDEDTIPFFAPLKLIQYEGDGHFEMRRSPAKEIPPEIVLFCIISDNQNHLEKSQQIGVDKLLEAMDSNEEIDANDGMISVAEFIQMVNVQSETIEKYIRDGSIVPDSVITQSEHRSIKLFKKRTVLNYANQFGWTISLTRTGKMFS